MGQKDLWPSDNSGVTVSPHPKYHNQYHTTVCLINPCQQTNITTETVMRAPHFSAFVLDILVIV